MYPTEELTRLGVRKLALRRDIALHRVQFTTAAARVAKPLAVIDRMLASWRRLAPFAKMAAVPLAFLASRTLLPRLKFLVPLVRWAPVVFTAARGLGSVLRFPIRPTPR